jgi:hypothetical protein
VEVLHRVRGELVAIDLPIIVHDLSRTGFAVLSQLAFAAGDTLDFRLVAAGETAETPVSVSARAVHSRPVGDDSALHLTGFMFIAGPLTGRVPEALIDRLIEAVRKPKPMFVAI